MKWVCATDFLLFDFPIWISAGWMDALLLLLQLRNSLSEFGPALIRPPPPIPQHPPPPHYHLIPYAGPPLPESLLSHKTPTITQASATITERAEHLNMDHYMRLSYHTKGIVGNKTAGIGSRMKRRSSYFLQFIWSLRSWLDSSGLHCKLDFFFFFKLQLLRKPNSGKEECRHDNGLFLKTNVGQEAANWW